MISKFALFLLCSLAFVSHAVNIGCPDENKKEIRKFAQQVEEARACVRDSDCTTYKFHKLSSGCQTFDSAINKTTLKPLIKKYKMLPYCYHGVNQCLFYQIETDKVICENKLCTIKYKDSQSPQFLFKSIKL